MGIPQDPDTHVYKSNLLHLDFFTAQSLTAFGFLPMPYLNAYSPSPCLCAVYCFS